MDIPKKYNNRSKSVTIDMKADRSERVKYNTAGLPVYLKKGFLSLYPGFAAESHWHDDLEFIVIQRGEMQYSVNGETVTLCEGNGIFVNARQFHFGFSDNLQECEFLCILLHPVLLCSSQYVEQNFVAPILSDASFPYYVFHRGVTWENKVLTALVSMFFASEMEIISLFYGLWNELSTHRQSIPRKPANGNSKLNVLKDMIAFIQNNYRERLSLADIAKAGSVCKTECCTVFQKYANLTPILYLNDYRLRKSAELLTQTDLSVTEICYEVGFSGASYFTETFKKTFHCTPMQYRKSGKTTLE